MRVCVPGDAPMQCPTLQHTPQVNLCGGLFVRVDICEERLANEQLCLFSQVMGKIGIEIDEL